MSKAFSRHRNRLLRVIAFRMHPALQRRVDPSDVLQEAFVEAARRYSEYQQREEMPLFLWLRFLVVQKLLHLHRQHLDVRARDARREVALPANDAATSQRLAQWLVASQTSPSGRVEKAELIARVQEALDRLSPQDREILALRHFEQLTTAEIAAVLEITLDAARKRYFRALNRIREVLDWRAGHSESRGLR